MSAPYPELDGFRALPGFVKSNPLNNDYYVDTFADDPWYPAIKSCHEQLSQVIPGYNIAQIKSKFGGLRYYIDYPDEIEFGLDSTMNRWCNSRQDVIAYAEKIIRYAEGWVDGYEYCRASNA